MAYLEGMTVAGKLLPLAPIPHTQYVKDHRGYRDSMSITWKLYHLSEPPPGSDLIPL